MLFRMRTIREYKTNSKACMKRRRSEAVFLTQKIVMHFSSESEKKIRSSYLGLKAISLDEALTAQAEKDPALLRAQLEPASVKEPPPTIADKANAVFSVVDMMHKTPVIIATALVCLSFLGIFFVGNLYRTEGHLEEGESLFCLEKISRVD